MSVDHFVSVTLFDRDGATPLKRLHRAYAMQWLDENAAPGSFSFTLPAEDDAQVAVGRIVKFSYGQRSDAYRWAGVIESITHRTTDDDDVVQISGRGVRALLEGAVVYPATGSDSQTRTYTDAYPSAIIREFISEAHDRGTLTEITTGFTSSADSNGTAFDADSDLTIDVEVGTSLADIVTQHQEAVLDSAWVDADLVLQYALERGTDTTLTADPVVFRTMQNVVSLERSVDGPVRNVSLVSYNDGAATTEKESTVSGSLSTFGRREQFIDFNNVGSASKAERYANKVMRASADATDGITLEVTDDGVKPYIDYRIGDYVWVVFKNGARTKYRVRSLTVTADGDGNVRVVPELGTVQANLEERLRRALDRLEGRNARGDTSALTPPQAGLTTTVPSGTFVIGTPVGSEFVYQSPTLQADSIDIADPTLAPYTSAYNGVEDTSGAAGAGANAICIIGDASSILSFNTVDGLVEVLPLPGPVPSWIAKWGAKLIAGTRALTGDGTVYVIDAGVVTQLTLTPPTAGQRLIGGGPASDGLGFIGVWLPAYSTNTGYMVKYDATGTTLGSRTITLPATASTGGPAVVENGYAVIRASYSSISTDYVLITGADLTSPVTTVSGLTRSSVSAQLGTISSDGYCWFPGRLGDRTLYRADCNTGTVAVYPYGMPDVYYRTYSVVSVSQTKAVWLGTYYEPLSSYFPTIINLVELSGVINATESKLGTGGNVASFAGVATATSDGDIAFVSNDGSVGRFFLRVAGP